MRKCSSFCIFYDLTNLLTRGTLTVEVEKVSDNNFLLILFVKAIVKCIIKDGEFVKFGNKSHAKSLVSVTVRELDEKTSLFITINVEEFISNLEKYKVRPEP